MTSRPKPAERQNETRSDEILLAALGEAAGPALVLDDRLRIVGATPGAEDAVGLPIELGVSAPALLCGSGPVRPMAEALAEGRPVTARIARPTPGGPERTVHVRAVPVGGEAHVGWLLFLDPEEVEGESEDGSVERWGITTRNDAMKRLLRDIAKVARSEASVLVRGETGSGKELVAGAIHAASRRSTGGFRALNCAALPPHLLESELFGHVRGAFTGAVRDVKGHFELADGGTLFLDEIAELPLELQAKLLRVVQERSVIPVGGREPIPVDVRLVAATHRALRREVEEGRFRADLMYRLRVVPIFLPPLRDRRDDIALLATRFVEQRNAVNIEERRVERISPGAMRALEAYDWPGNVRELVNAIEYAFVMGEGPVMTEADLPPEVRGEERAADAAHGAGEPPPRDLPKEARRLKTALDRAGGHHERAAKSLGISRTTLWRKLKKYGLA